MGKVRPTTQGEKERGRRGGTSRLATTKKYPPKNIHNRVAHVSAKKYHNNILLQHSKPPECVASSSMYASTVCFCAMRLAVVEVWATESASRKRRGIKNQTSATPALSKRYRTRSFRKIVCGVWAAVQSGVCFLTSCACLHSAHPVAGPRHYAKSTCPHRYGSDLSRY